MIEIVNKFKEKENYQLKERDVLVYSNRVDLFVGYFDYECVIFINFYNRFWGYVIDCGDGDGGIIFCQCCVFYL